MDNVLEFCNKKRWIYIFGVLCILSGILNALIPAIKAI